MRSNQETQVIVIIPGLGGEKPLRTIQRIVKGWEDGSIFVSLFDSRWHSDETVDDKNHRLLDFFNTHAGNNTVIVAYSAGGALATQLYTQAKAQIARVICISCKLHGSGAIGRSYQQRSPALVPAVAASETALTNLSDEVNPRFVCFKPLYDQVVPKKYMAVPGMRIKRIPFVFHSMSIGFALIFQVKPLLRAPLATPKQNLHF